MIGGMDFFKGIKMDERTLPEQQAIVEFLVAEISAGRGVLRNSALYVFESDKLAGMRQRSTDNQRLLDGVMVREYN